MARTPETPAPGRPNETGPAGATPRRRQPGPPIQASPSETPDGRQVVRPVALLALIDKVEKWEVDDNLIRAVFETVEAGLDIDRIYEGARAELADETSEEEEEKSSGPEVAKPLPVYKLGHGARIHFSKDGRPVSPTTHHIYIPGYDSENYFGCELEIDRMVADAPPWFRVGDIVIFSIKAPVENGDFVYIKTRGGDEFTQIFFEKEDAVRLRPLNPKHAEHSTRRFELKEMCKLAARIQKF